ncbi:MAG: single-stranded DNA-binding protein [Candidatus Doudnabacteria bacterium]|nr:single-stranded DNA-binding protein [Candidatus Doudnabacteria bacterium]
MDLNKAMIIGRLTRDPEVRSTPSGAKVASFGVATNYRWTDQQGQKHEQVEFHNVVVWRRLADIAEQYLKKGSIVYVEGRLQTRSWDGNDGQKKNRTEIIAEKIQLGPRTTPGSPAAEQPAQQPASQPEESVIQIEDSDIPF